MSLLWLLLVLKAAARELALVRPFASDQEIQDMDSAFRLWNVALPCSQALAEFDLFLVYSRRLEENPVAARAAQAVRRAFQSSSEPWHRCFRAVFVEAANLTADEDIYDSRGYTVRKDWVNGPNKVFRFILRSFLEKSFSSADYEAFYFMEFDSTPLRSFWLDQFYAEVFHYPRAAIRGSRYRGDSWDNFLHAIDESLLYHINGNAIYFLKHPWLRFLAGKLEEDVANGEASMAFDVRIAELTLGAEQTSEWQQLVPSGEDPYRDDSLLVGNYANTLLNESFDAPEFVRHGALSNVLESLDHSLVTLAVQSLAPRAQLLRSLTEASHPFREVLILSTAAENFTLSGPSGPSRVRVVPPSSPVHMALCDLAWQVETRHFVFTDTYHFIPGPTHILGAQNRSVLPYIAADSVHCTGFAECLNSLDQAESFYGVRLNYHHSKFETLFETALAREFCDSWRLAAVSLGSYEACGYHAPSADDYIAWLISMDKEFNYVPKNKGRVGWRPWSSLWEPHPPDPRNCSSYTESDMLKRGSTIKDCSLYIQNASACDANPNCTFRSLFEAGKCMASDEFQLLPAMRSSRTLTWSSTRSSTSGTSTWSSSSTTTRSTSVTSSTTGDFSTSTRTIVTQSTTTVPIFCEDGLPSSAGVDVSDCAGRFAGESCTVLCAGAFEGPGGGYVCGLDGTFVGNVSCQEIACSQETLPVGYVTDCEGIRPGGACIVSCPSGFAPATSIYFCLPFGSFLGFPPTCEALSCQALEMPLGVQSNCQGLRYGQSCTASCSYGFTGMETQFICSDGTLQGSLPSCARKPCALPLLPVSLSTTCAGAVHGTRCLASCSEGFVGEAMELSCTDGTLLGQWPECNGVECGLEGLPLQPAVDTSNCQGIRTLENCSQQCLPGYQPEGDGSLTCQSDRRFSASSFTCQPDACGDLSAVPSFSSPAYDSSCANRSFGETCAVFCRLGWRLEGNVSSMQCMALGSNGFASGFVRYFAENRSSIAAEDAQSPNCVALECTENLPDLSALHDCLGKRTGESCRVRAAPGYVAEPPETELMCWEGTFQGTMPRIQPAICPSLPGAVGVGSTCGNATMGTECWAYCQSGFLGAPRRYECVLNSTGQLELQAEEPVVCSPQRRLLSCEVDVRLFDTRFLHSCAAADEGDVCLVHCSPGYSMASQPTLLSCQNGQLTGGALPSCSPGPCSFAFPSGLGVRHNCDGQNTGENCTAWCEEGFSGEPEVFQCTSFGSFLGRSPRCSRELCPDLQLSEELYEHNCRNRLSGETCGVVCRRGFFLSSVSSQLRCNGSFQGELPRCSPDPCESLVIQGDVFSGRCEGLATGETCAVECNAGFVPNRSLLTCTAEGFLGTYPLCTPARCELSPELQDVRIAHDCDGVAFGRSCNVYCAPGYELMDSVAQWSCQVDGLQGVLPRCVPLPCSLGVPGDSNCSGLSFRETCTAQCQRGFIGEAQSFSCGLDGVAVGQQPSCELITCNSNLSLPGVVTTCEGVQVNRSCFAFCGPGYRLEGEAQRWDCSDSHVPAIDASTTVAGVALRGLLPVCLLDTCSYNIPWSPRFSHNCQAVETWDSCEVSCSNGFEGDLRRLRCEPNGALLGDLPSCRPVTFTSTGTSSQTTTATISSTLSWSKISANLTLQVSNPAALVAHPATLSGFQRALAELFQANPEVTLEEGPPLRVLASWSSRGLETPPLAEVERVINAELQEVLRNTSQGNVSALELKILEGDSEPRIWRPIAQEPVSEDNSPLVAALAASGAALCCICGAAGACRYQRREVPMKPAEPHEASSDSTEEGATVESWPLADEGVTSAVPCHRDFSASGDRDVRLLVQDEELFLAGICLEQDEQSDPEEVRLSLEDVGVDYEAAEASQSGSSVAESEDDEDGFAL